MLIKPPQSIMSDSILQKYVDEALLGTKVIQSVEDFENLNKASTQLVKKLTQKKRKPDLISFILLGITPNIRPEEPLLDEVKAIIKGKNKLFISRSKDKAVTVIRAVILDALERMAKDNMAVCTAIYLTGRKYFEHINYSSKEKGVIKHFLLETGKTVEQYSITSWKIENVEFKSISSPEYQTQLISSNLVGNTNALKSQFDNVPEIGVTAVRSNYGSHNNIINSVGFKKWYSEFSAYISEAIVSDVYKKIQGIITPLNNSLKSLQEQVVTHTQSLSRNINEATKSLIKGTNSLRKRDQIIWWKETLFSNSLKRSYRDFENEVLRNIIMAYDYYWLVPGYCPLSVDYFFKEAIIKMGTSSNEISFEEILQLLKDKESSAITQIWNSYEKTDKIMPVPEFINGFVHNHYKADEFEKLTYVKLSDKIKLTDLGLWVFHYLQSKHLLK